MAEIRASFRGGAAEEHRLPALEGTESLAGIARALTIAAHYTAEGSVRHKAPFSENARVEILDLEEGSLEGIFDVSFRDIAGFLANAAASGSVGNFFYDLLKVTLRRMIGRISEPTNEHLANVERQRPGELQALSDAIEPAIIRGHMAIDNGVQNIVLIRGDNNIVTFNRETKQYVTTNLLDRNDTYRTVSVGSYNVNTRYGRAFDYEEGRTIPFHVARVAGRDTIDAITWSLREYASYDKGGAIRATVLCTRGIDGRIRRMTLLEAKRSLAL